MDAVTLGMAKADAKKKLDAKFLTGSRRNGTRNPFATAPAGTIGAVSGTTTLASGISRPAVNYAQINTDFWSYRGAGGPVPLGSTTPDNAVLRFSSCIAASLLTAPVIVETMHYGTAIELITKGTIGYVRVRVDGVLIDLVGTVTTATGALAYLPVTFTTAMLRRVTFELYGVTFGGFRIGTSDALIKPPPVRGPRVIVVGDSFTGATGATGASWVRVMADKLGWDDVWASGAGGTGWLNPGPAGAVKFRDRLVSDVINWSPDMVIFAGGRNDLALAPSAVQTEIETTLAALKAALPRTKIVMLSPFWAGGVKKWGNVLLPIKDAVQAAAVAGKVDAYIDVLEMPIPGVTLPSGTMHAATLVNYTTFNSVTAFPNGCTVEIGTGTTRERRVVTGTSASNPIIHAVSALTYAHSAGEAIRQVGPALFTGTGRVGTVVGDGNSDVFTTADDVHPAQPGHDAIGLYVASRIEAELLAA